MALVHRRIRSGLIGDEGPDLTPMIDCVFLLLIFFMVTTVFLHTKGLDVDLPAKSESQQQQEKKDINVVIDSRGRIQIGGEDVLPAALATRLERAMQEANNDNIIIQGHPDCPQEHVVAVVDAAKKANVAGIAFAREEGTF
jgi:biopolymer transport protein ExbD